MRVAVTGGTGFVGAHSVHALVEAGHDVRLLLHPDDSTAISLEPLGVHLADEQIVVGDVCDPEAVARLLTGCDAVLHAAGIVGVDDAREALMWKVNVGATAHVLTRAVMLGLDPIVHVASYSALFPSPDPVLTSESPTTVGARSAYGRTKAAADTIARGLQDAGAPVVITYPSSIVGPPAGQRRGVTADGWAPLLRSGISVSFDGAMTMIDVRDVADFHAVLMHPGRGPRRYTLGGELLAFDEIIDLLEQAAGRPIRRIRVSRSMVRAGGRLADLAARHLRFPPGFSYEAAWLLTSAKPTDDRPALADLGRPWRSVRAALLESLEARPGAVQTRPGR